MKEDDTKSVKSKKPSKLAGATSSKNGVSKGTGGKEPPTGSASKSGDVAIDAAVMVKIHSAFRWAKTRDEIQQLVAAEAAGSSLLQAAEREDERTGNRCLHIAAQNGHRDLVQFLIEQRADVNCQNKKGQTPLHMLVKYDMYFLAKYLVDQGANPKVKNADGHEAITGLDGDKVGAEAWDSPLRALKDASDDKDELEIGFGMLERSDLSTIDKAMLVQIGLSKRKECATNWDHARFTSIFGKL